MSAIAITSSGSGAGTLSIAAPITATNRTLTLPDASGVLGAYPQIYSITASVASSALTVTLNPCALDFRATPITSGTVNTRTVASAISVVVPSTATLGTINATLSRLYVIALDNAGTVELAVANLFNTVATASGGLTLDETGLLSTTAIAAGSNLSATAYSTTARTSLPYRVVGYVESTQATAGTWATAPSTIQGDGGQALTTMNALGYGQTWQNVTASRAYSTTYYNTTGKPIFATVTNGTSAGTLSQVATVNGVTAAQSLSSVASTGGNIGFLIPPSGSYSVTASSGAPQVWSELR